MVGLVRRDPLAGLAGVVEHVTVVGVLNTAAAVPADKASRDLAGAPPHRRRVVPRLHPQQHFHIDAERLFDPQRHLGRQRRLAIQQIGEGGPGARQAPRPPR